MTTHNTERKRIIGLTSAYFGNKSSTFNIQFVESNIDNDKVKHIYTFTFQRKLITLNIVMERDEKKFVDVSRKVFVCIVIFCNLTICYSHFLENNTGI